MRPELFLKLAALSPMLMLLLLISITPYPIRSATAECEPKSCGRVANIAFPFWLRDQQQPTCGPPGFELTCENGFPILARSVGKSYYIYDIFYGNYSFWVKNKNLNNEACPIPTPDDDPVSDLPGPLRVSRANRELLFFYNCSAPPTNNSTRVPCAPHNTFARLGGSYDGNPDPPMASSSKCNMSMAPVLLSDRSEEESGRDFEALLKNGYLVEWGGYETCWECRASNGTCKYNDTTAAFICVCPDGRRSPTNCRSNHKTGIIIGVCVGVGGLVLATLCGLFFYRHGKRRRQSSTLLPQTVTSELFSKTVQEFGSELQSTRIFKYEELHEATDGFNASNELGHGGFGTVYKGNLKDGRTVAIKRLYENNYRRVEQFMTEVSILSSLSHQNLVSLYGCTSRHSPELILVYEYVPNGTVADHLHGPRAGEEGLPWPVRMSIAIETADALSYLHAVTPHQIIHRDVKSNNILLDSSFRVKVADFGLSRLFPVNATHVSTAPQGTPGYVDPEYYQCYHLTDKSDVYSFGVVLVELISSKPAVDLRRQRHEINLAGFAISKIQNEELDQLVDRNLWGQSSGEVIWMIRQVAEVAFRCLQGGREMRPTMREVLEALRGIEDMAGCSSLKGTVDADSGK